MKRYFWVLPLCLAMLQVAGAQSDAKQKLEKARQILTALDLGKLDPALLSPVDDQLGRVLAEARKLHGILYPPSAPAHWQMKYEDGAWKAKDGAKRLTYVPAPGLLKSGHWVEDGKNTTIPEMKKNAFYTVGGPFDGTWKDWGEEAHALSGAVSFWKSSLDFALPAEEKEIMAWLTRLEERHKLLQQERSLYGDIEAVPGRLKSSGHAMAEDLASLDQGISLTRTYLARTGAGEITSHYASAVSARKQAWESMRAGLNRLESLAGEIQAAIGKIRQGVPADALRRELESALKLAEEYQKLCAADELKPYRAAMVGEWQEEIQSRLSQAIVENEIAVLRESHDSWLAQQNKGTIDEEGRALEKFLATYEHYRAAVAGQKDNPYRDLAERWLASARDRSQSLSAEKSQFERVESSYAAWKKCDSASSPEARLKALKEGIAATQAYQNLLQEGKISRYHQPKVAECHSAMNKAREVLDREEELFGRVRDTHRRFEKGEYGKLAAEKDDLAQILFLLSEYDRLLEAKDIGGHREKELRAWGAAVQERQKSVIGEENLFVQIDAAVRKWESESQWENLKAEQNVLTRALDCCREYQKKAGGKEISTYYREDIARAEQKLGPRRQKLDGEERIFEEIRRLQADHAQKTYPDLPGEEKAIDDFLSRLKIYLDKLQKDEVSGYYRTEASAWHGQLEVQKNKVALEKERYGQIAEKYRNWQKQASWEGLEQELAALEVVVRPCEEYQEGFARQEIRGYYRSEVGQYLKSLHSRIQQLRGEKDLASRIEAKWQDLAKSKSLEDGQNDLKSFLVLCQDYQNQLASAKISDYHRARVAERTAGAGEQIRQLDEIVRIARDLKARYENWEITRWPSFDGEEKALAEISSKAKEYQDLLGKTAFASQNIDLKQWLETVAARNRQMQGEKAIYDKIVKLEETVNEGNFASLAEEKQKIRDVETLAEEHKDSSDKKEISGHYQRNIRQIQKKLAARTEKLDREEWCFQEADKAYRAWKQKSWDNPASEKNAVDEAMKKIDEYNEHLQRKKISAYYQKQVKQYEEELAKRKGELPK